MTLDAPIGPLARPVGAATRGSPDAACGWGGAAGSLIV